MTYFNTEVEPLLAVAKSGANKHTYKFRPTAPPDQKQHPDLEQEIRDVANSLKCNDPLITRSEGKTRGGRLTALHAIAHLADTLSSDQQIYNKAGNPKETPTERNERVQLLDSALKPLLGSEPMQNLFRTFKTIIENN